jgi:parallel beta-helix repeat protein
MPRRFRRAALPTFLTALVALVCASLTVIGVAPAAHAAGCDPNFVPADGPNLQDLMAQCPDGTTYRFAPGTYRINDQILPQDGDTLIGSGSGPGGTRITGSKVITGWEQSGDVWVHEGDTELVGIMPDPCEDGTTACDYQDWLFQDGDYMKRVLPPCGSLADDEFCINYVADKMYIGTRPAPHLFEYSYIHRMMGGRYDDVTITHLSFDEFATNGAAIPAGAGWLVDDVRGYHNHACAIDAMYSTVSNPAVIQDSTFDHNGYHGICEYSHGMQLLDNVFSYNNAVGYAHGSGVSIHAELDGVIHGNAVYGNDGAGITIGPNGSNVGSDNVQVIGNTVYGNTADGIRVEHSCNNLISGNVIYGNLGFGVELVDASDNIVAGNTILVPPDAYQGGIRVFADDTNGSNNCGPLDDARDNTMTANDITMRSIADPGPMGNINGIVNTGGLTSGNTFAGNDYHLPGGDCSVTNWQIWTGYVQQKNSFDGWQAHGQDLGPGGTCGE